MDPDLRPRVLLAAGVAAVVVGALLPWATVSAGLFSHSVAGTEGDGVITLIMGLVVGGLVLAKWKAGLGKGFSITTIVLGALIALVGVVDAVDISSVAEEAGLFQVSASVGIGLWLTILGGAALVAGGIWELRTAPAPPPPEHWGAPWPGPPPAHGSPPSGAGAAPQGWGAGPPPAPAAPPPPPPPPAPPPPPPPPPPRPDVAPGAVRPESER